MSQIYFQLFLWKKEPFFVNMDMVVEDIVISKQFRIKINVRGNALDLDGLIVNG